MSFYDMLLTKKLAGDSGGSEGGDLFFAKVTFINTNPQHWYQVLNMPYLDSDGTVKIGGAKVEDSVTLEIPAYKSGFPYPLVNRFGQLSDDLPVTEGGVTIDMENPTNRGLVVSSDGTFTASGIGQ